MIKIIIVNIEAIDDAKRYNPLSTFCAFSLRKVRQEQIAFSRSKKRMIIISAKLTREVPEVSHRFKAHTLPTSRPHWD